MSITQIGYSRTNCCDLDYYFEATIRKFADFDAVFIGSISQGSFIKSEISNGNVNVKVLKTFKGNLQKTEIVNFNYFGAWAARKGEKYLIFADFNKNGNLYTNECAGSSIIDQSILKISGYKRDTIYRQAAKITKQNILFLNNLLTINEDYSKFYFSNGQIMAEGKWKNGFPVGLWKHYNKAGELKSEGTYNTQGKKIGEWKNIVPLENYYETINKKFIYLKKGFLFEYEQYIDGKYNSVKYEFYDIDKNLVIDKKGNICKKIYNQDFFVVDDEG